jgi:hypothetical protein
MRRLTIALTDERYREQRQAAAVLVARARGHAALEDDAALMLAVDEVRQARR